MKYCNTCVMPTTRPGMSLDETGVCRACRWQEEKKNIDWKQRENEFRKIGEWAKATTKAAWDCVLGVSGGKDSTWQAFYVRDVLGLRPLLVQFVSSDGTALGRTNMENLLYHGFDHISVQPDPATARHLSRESFLHYGNLNKYAELALFSVPFRTAINYEIPLVLFGENPALEAGDCNQGEGWDATSIRFNNTLGGAAWEIWLDEVIHRKNLLQYRFPSEEELSAWGGKGVFMGYFLEWSGSKNAAFAMQHGMQCIDADYKDIGVHYLHSCLDSNNSGPVNSMLKHVKFGFGNTTELSSYDVRHNRLSRAEAALLIRELDGKCASRYITAYCDWVGISGKEFQDVANSCRGPMWETSGKGDWRLKDPLWEQIPVADNVSWRDIIEKLNRRPSHTDSADVREA